MSHFTAQSAHKNKPWCFYMLRGRVTLHVCRLIHLKKADLSLKMSQPVQVVEKIRDNSWVAKTLTKLQNVQMTLQRNID